MPSSRRASGTCRRATATCSSECPPPSARVLSTLARRSAGTWLNSSSSSGCCSLRRGRQGGRGGSRSSASAAAAAAVKLQPGERHAGKACAPCPPPTACALVLCGQVQSRRGAAARVAAADGRIRAGCQQQPHHVWRVGGHRPAAGQQRGKLSRGAGAAEAALQRGAPHAPHASLLPPRRTGKAPWIRRRLH